MIDRKKDFLVSDNKIIASWLKERKELLVLYSQLVAINDETPEAEEIELINSFSAVLIDYVSTGHFGVYEQLIPNLSLSKEHQAHIFGQIYQTTEIALAFNDNYENISAKPDLDKFTKDFSIIGEAISIRIDLEDKLLASR
ncbi:MAG: Rsd/AlgQ family anti-sigma factor [Gammaproteobacteria bacterium]|nr:MAG: Rsd/AlgQ family anti-sigma factor [Gammaproteobacteria bacterium]